MLKLIPLLLRFLLMGAIGGFVLIKLTSDHDIERIERIENILYSLSFILLLFDSLVNHAEKITEE